MRRPANRFQERPFPVSSNFQRGPIATTNLRRAILQVVDEFDAVVDEVDEVDEVADPCSILSLVHFEPFNFELGSF